MEIKICCKCGKTFEHKRKDTLGKYCSRTCSDAVNKNPPAAPRIKKTCPYCKAEFLLAPRHSHVVHCSSKCAKRHAAETLRGENHPLFKPKTVLKCEVCGKECEVKPSLVKRFRACSRRCACIIGLMTWPRVSTLEMIMQDAMTTAGLSPESQYLIGFYPVDFAFLKDKLVVECDGEYWHREDVRGTKDKQKDTYLDRRGWRVLRLQEGEIRNATGDCVKRVQEALQELL